MKSVPVISALEILIGKEIHSLWDDQNYWGILQKKNILQELVRRGIPHHFRGLAWQLLLGVHDSPHKQLYVEYLKQTSPSEKLIRRDIARTFPDHDFFKEKDGLGQESLFNVMKVGWLLVALYLVPLRIQVFMLEKILSCKLYNQFI